MMSIPDEDKRTVADLLIGDLQINRIFPFRIKPK
jgi:hypothetical protein